jgi:hypothetical protein
MRGKTNLKTIEYEYKLFRLPELEERRMKNRTVLIEDCSLDMESKATKSMKNAKEMRRTFL